MKKIIIFILSLILFSQTLKANDVDYKVYDYIVDAKIDTSGNLNVKEVIGIKGTFNGYIRDLVYKNSRLNEFTGIYEDFKGSSIYNATNIEIEKVGSISWKGDLTFDVFDKEINPFQLSFQKCNSPMSCYEQKDITNGISLKMYNRTKKDITYFYIEYTLANVVVVHNDVAELYYSFIGDMFDDTIMNYNLRVNLPFTTNEQIRLWAHGPLDGTVYLIGEYEGKKYFITEGENGKLKLKNNEEEKEIEKNNEITYYGGYLTIEDLERNTPVDMRITFPTDLIKVSHPSLKKSNIEALENILQIEEMRANDANKKRSVARIKIYTTYIITGLYLLGILVFSLIIYIKYDKERKAHFNLIYNREFIDDYDVTVIEYLFCKRITEKAFSTSILNMIYKKNISFKKINDKEYTFTKINEDGLDNAEKVIMEIIFDESGDGKTTSLSKIKKYAKKVNGTSSPFLSSYSRWKNLVLNASKKENFFENNIGIKIFAGIYSSLMIIILFMHISFDIFNILTINLVIFTVVFLLYSLLFTKKTRKGIEHYSKWKAFKRFLLDFGRFKEKELPEITLWERYLVYANIFGIADKVSKTMKIKFKETTNIDNKNEDILFDYIMWSHLNRSINNAVNSSITIARTSVSEAAASSNSSSGGFGGGFSSGGGFAGGGGGGRGF